MIENWNCANGFVFFGTGGEIATSRVSDQEIASLLLELSKPRLPPSTHARFIRS
ncbi:MAG: hypothetical protein OXN84_10925 [Albidovulum sp.]|nr:hypothetical protein [Albidovulum sp.]MDE0532735.1 hypothetical protein [Albidovulum sp.]